MIRKVLLLIQIIIIAIFPVSAHAFQYDAKYKDEILKLIVPSVTVATINNDCALKSKPKTVSKTIGVLKKGLMVEVLMDSSEKWYNVSSEDENENGWVLGEYIDIHEEENKMIPVMTNEQVEAFANIMNFPSNSKYFIWTDIARQKTHVFEKARNNYVLIKTFDCSTGKTSTPTTRGFFTVSERGEWFYSKRFDSGACFWVRFNETYLFHSVAMDKNKNITDGKLGERRSSGCVRLGVSDAEWIFLNIPKGTSVFVH